MWAEEGEREELGKAVGPEGGNVNLHLRKKKKKRGRSYGCNTMDWTCVEK